VAIWWDLVGFRVVGSRFCERVMDGDRFEID
jgi:hypothetical protein